MNKKLILSALFSLFLATSAYAGDVSKAHTYVDGEVLTAALLNASFDEIILEVNDLDSDNLASDIAIVTTGVCRFANKVAFTQSDNLEYIDSLASGYLDFEATTGLRMRINATEQINLVDGILQPTTDNDVDLGATTKEYKDLFIDGTANIDTAVITALSGLTTFTASGALDIGGYNFRALSLTADSLTSGRVAFASTNGLLIDDGDLTFATDTLTATKIGAYTLSGKLTAGAVEIEGSAFDINGGTISSVTLDGKMTAGATEIEGSGFDINGGAIDGVTIGGAAAPTVTDLGSVATADINGGTMDGVTIGTATATGSVFYNDASDDAVALTNGDAGEVLTANGTAAPSWDAPDFQLVSKTTFTDANDTDAIAITQGVRYMVIADFVPSTVSETLTTTMEFGDVTDWDANANYTDNGGTESAATKISLTGALEDDDPVSGFAHIVMYFAPIFSDQMVVHGHGMYLNATPTTAQLEIYGHWDSSETVTRFRLRFANGATGQVLLYKLGES